MKTVFPAHTSVIWPVEGRKEGFAVRRVFCVGKNYADHVAEMGGDAARSEPIFFTKDASCLVADGAVIGFPPNTDDLHHEVELVVAIGPDGGVWGCAVGLDMTRRDLQAKAKAKGQPWDRAKSFAQSAPMGFLREGAVPEGMIHLRVNGTTVQESALSKMIWSVDEIIERLSVDMDLQAGDVIFTGTPAGVGPVRAGDVLEAEVEGLPGLRVRYSG